MGVGQASLQVCDVSPGCVFLHQPVLTPLFHLLVQKHICFFGCLCTAKITAILFRSWAWPGPSLTWLNTGIKQARLATGLALAQLRREFGLIDVI